MPLKKIRLVWLLLILAACRPEERSNFGVEAWSGRLLDGSVVRFSDLPQKQILINFYSPTCQPCITELPALELLRKEAAARGIPFYMALEPSAGAHGLTATGSVESTFEVIRNRMLEDVQKYRITIPVMIMDPPFQIEPGSSTVTGTPETLVLSTRPLLLKYNFIGPISMSQKPREIELETRYKFVLERL